MKVKNQTYAMSNDIIPKTFIDERLNWKRNIGKSSLRRENGVLAGDGLILGILKSRIAVNRENV